MKTQAWHWIDTHGSITSKYTLVRFGRGELASGEERAPFVFGEALIEEPMHQRYETMRGVHYGTPQSPRRVDITLHAAEEDDATKMFLNDPEMSLTADGITIPSMLGKSSETRGDLWTLRAVGGSAEVTVESTLGPPKDMQDEARRKRIAEAYDAYLATVRGE